MKRERGMETRIGKERRVNGLGWTIRAPVFCRMAQGEWTTGNFCKRSKLS